MNEPSTQQDPPSNVESTNTVPTTGGSGNDVSKVLKSENAQAWISLGLIN